MGLSVPSLHRESTDSLISCVRVMHPSSAFHQLKYNEEFLQSGTYVLLLHEYTHYVVCQLLGIEKPNTTYHELACMKG